MMPRNPLQPPRRATISPHGSCHEPDPIPRSRPGVYEVAFPPTGYRAFATVYANGDIGYIQEPVARVTAEFVNALVRRREESDQPTLRMVNPSA